MTSPQSGCDRGIAFRPSKNESLVVVGACVHEIGFEERGDLRRDRVGILE